VKPDLNKKALQALQNYDFPGNVRELENILERALTWVDGHEITDDDLMLPVKVRTQNTLAERFITENTLVSDDLESRLEDQERQMIINALESTRWNRTAAAKQLGITFRALRYKIKKLNLEE
jgi:two-component system response regulator PilR (NtrC family)